MRETLIRTAGAAATEEAAQAIENWATGRLRTFEDAERGLCFGRIDSEESADRIYVGRRWVHDDARRSLVVNWQAPAARPFYTATPAAPRGVTLRRRFRTRGRTLTGISDESLDGSLADAATSVDDFLLEELERTRDARMRDIVATIQADQYHLIARAPELQLVIQGGPGTGKTAVGLHRASFLLFEHRAELRRVLVVGPNPAFMEYVSHVLPTLGEDSVDQRAVAELVEDVEVTRVDPLDVQRLKADTRLVPELHRLVEAASEGEPQELVVRMEGRFVGDEARALIVGTPQQYGHVIVDEAQDLTPMQLRMVARRASGAFTILGDIAQATGPISYDRWDELLPHLPDGEDAEVAELKHAYRVPREIMAVALPLLELIAPGVEPPLAYRVGAEPPRVVSGDPPLQAAYEEAARLAGDEGLLAVIAPASRRGDDAGSLFDETRIAVLTPREAKGMEFDNVIVVEPAQIVEEAAEGQGLRELYVALTRPTTRLILVHSRPLPKELKWKT